MNRSLESQFSLLFNNNTCDEQNKLPAGSYSDEFHFELSGFTENIQCKTQRYEKADIDLLTSYFANGFDYSLPGKNTRAFFDISFDAFDVFLHAWLSELPIEQELIKFGKKIIASIQHLGSNDEKHFTAVKLINNRLDTDTRTVLNASAKVHHEVHRMMGLLRFNPNADNEFTAKCEPDHFILPAFGKYFTSRFGETSWSIIDEKRKLCLRRANGKQAKIHELDESGKDTNGKDEWEELWKHYHCTINNEDRNNPDLQRQLMPKRYWKYLPEV